MDAEGTKKLDIRIFQKQCGVRFAFSRQARFGNWSGPFLDVSADERLICKTITYVWLAFSASRTFNFDMGLGIFVLFRYVRFICTWCGLGWGVGVHCVKSWTNTSWTSFALSIPWAPINRISKWTRERTNLPPNKPATHIYQRTNKHASKQTNEQTKRNKQTSAQTKNKQAIKQTQFENGHANK